MNRLREREFKRAQIEAEQASTSQEREFRRAQMKAEEASREHEYEREREREEKRRKYEYEQKRLELEASGVAARVTGAHDARSKTPKLPPLSRHDELNSYLQRFERFASSAWKEDEWATYISALLTGKALDTYSRLSDADAGSYARRRAPC